MSRRLSVTATYCLLGILLVWRRKGLGDWIHSGCGSNFASIAAPSFEVLLIIQRKRKVQIVTKVLLELGALRAHFGEIGRCEPNRLSWIPYRPFVTWGYLFAQEKASSVLCPRSTTFVTFVQIVYAGGVCKIVCVSPPRGNVSGGDRRRRRAFVHANGRGMARGRLERRP